MTTYYVKLNDTGTPLEVLLKNPDGTAHDLTPGQDVFLHIWLSDGTKLDPRVCTIEGDPTLGAIQYAWIAGDWAADQLVASPEEPLTPGVRDHRMEIEVLDGSVRTSFPNKGWDTLHVTEDIGQGS